MAQSTEKVYITYPTSEVPYTISDSLKNRYPYTQPTFQKDIESIKTTVFPSYGLDGMKRNIQSLLSSEFETKEKEKALRILYTQLFDPKTQIRILELNIIEAIFHLLNKRPSQQCDALTSKIVQRLGIQNQGREAIVNRGIVELLLNIILDPQAGQESIEACKAILFISRSREGVNYLLNREMKHKTVVQGLVEVLNTKQFQNNSQLLYIAMEALIEICRTPFGRTESASAQALDSLNSILKRPSLGIQRDQNGYIIESADYIITRNATHLIWNICLDGIGKKLGTDVILSLSRVLHEAIQISNKSLIRFTTGALMAILVYEPSKPIVLKIVPVPNANVTLLEILCQFFEYANENGDKFTTEKGDSETDTLENILFNVKSCLRLATEYPEVRSRTKKLLKSNYLELIGI